MKTVGIILTESRIKNNISISAASRDTKIRPKTIQLIESDNYTQIGGGATARGFIRNYSTYLGLNPDHMVAIFRRDFFENQSGHIVPRGVAEPVDQTNIWTPKLTIFALVTCLFIIMAGYLIYQYRVLTGPPTLIISNPSIADTNTTDPQIVIEGVTDPEANISINGQAIALDKGGHFNLKIDLHEGSNQVSIVSLGKSGSKNEAIRVVNLTLPPQNVK